MLAPIKSTRSTAKKLEYGKQTYSWGSKL